MDIQSIFQNKKFIVAIIIVIILIVATYYYYYYYHNSTPEFKLYKATNILYGRGLSPKNSNYNLKYYSETPDQTSCQKICKNDPWCRAYTWNDESTGAWHNQCYGSDSTFKLTSQPNHFSGVKPII
jgi:hypothetical protein